MTPRQVVLAAGALLALSTAAASAHSLLLESSPAAGAVVEAPRDVRLRFNGRVEKRLSRLVLVGERGEARSLVLDLAGPPERLTASLPPLAAGRYRLEWHVLSTDGHVVSGSYVFINVGSGAPDKVGGSGAAPPDRSFNVRGSDAAPPDTPQRGPAR